MTEKPDVVMHKIDSETLGEISRAHDELVKCVDWFLSRNDIEAVERLMPIVDSIGNRLMAIYEGSYPEIGPCIDAINRFGDEMVQRFIQTRTPEERKFLFKYVTEAIAQWKQESAKIALEVKEIEKKKKSTRKRLTQAH